MGTYETLSNLVRTRVKTEIEDALSLSVHYPNESQARPESGKWVECSIHYTEAEALSSGSPYWLRTSGLLELSLWDDLEKGDSGVLTVANTAQTAFRGVTAASVHYETLAIRRIPRMDKSFGVEVLVPFFMDTQHTQSLGGVSVPSLTPSQVGNSIRGWFNTYVTSAESLTTHWENAPVSEPDAARWCRVSVQEGEPQRLGGGIQRVPGILFVQVFTPIGKGTKDGLEAADWAADAFRNTRIDGISFRTPTLTAVGADRDGKWWQQNLDCPFSYDATE